MAKEKACKPRKSKKFWTVIVVSAFSLSLRDKDRERESNREKRLTTYHVVTW